MCHAITQTIERTFDDLLPADGKRPVVKTDFNFQGAAKKFTVASISKNWAGLRIAKDFQFSVTLNTAHDARYTNSVTQNGYDGDANWGYLHIPYNNGEGSISDILTDQIIANIEEQICAGIQYNDRILSSDNNDQASRLTEIVREHLHFALSGAFGNGLQRLTSKELNLANFDTQSAEQVFRDEFKSLRQSGKSDFYLLSVFGVAAMAASAEDATIINEWETARAFTMPPSMNKIRHINKALKTLNGLDKEDRARNASDLLSQIRSMQKTISRDLTILSYDAKAIHGAKTIMNAHEENLKKYVQGYETIRGHLTERFGVASVDEKAIDLRTALTAAQIHNASQQITHELLTARMLRNLSSLSTRMAFVAQSMSQVAAQSLEATMGNDDTLEARIDEKIGILLETFEPLASDIDTIEELLALEDSKEPLLMITHQTPQPMSENE